MQQNFSCSLSFHHLPSPTTTLEMTPSGALFPFPKYTRCFTLPGSNGFGLLVLSGAGTDRQCTLYHPPLEESGSTMVDLDAPAVHGTIDRLRGETLQPLAETGGYHALGLIGAKSVRLLEFDPGTQLWTAHALQVSFQVQGGLYSLDSSFYNRCAFDLGLGILIIRVSGSKAWIMSYV
jgi:hypothetical protein